jgi:iron(III) transport system substrate-binding protein
LRSFALANLNAVFFVGVDSPKIKEAKMKFMNLKAIQSLLIGCFVAVFLCSLFVIVPLDKASADQSEEERTAKLVEGAKKEGAVLWYTTTPPDSATKYIKPFQERYPFIKVSMYRAGDEALMIRVMAEYRAKRHTFDVLQNGVINQILLGEKGITGKYFSPQRKFYPKIFKDPEGYWTCHQFNVDTIGYNTRLVSPAEAPKTWNDLLDPKWKGKMGSDSKSYLWLAMILKMMGEKKGLEYIEKLSNQDIKFRAGHTLNAQMVVAGEVHVGINLFNYTVEQMKSQGAPIEWVPFDPVIPELYPISISANPPHPNAAKLLYDYILSKECQKILASTFRIPGRTDVNAIVPELKKGLNIMPTDLSIARDYEKYVKLFHQVFMKR